MNDIALFDSMFNDGFFDSFPMYSYRKALSLPRADVKEDASGYTIEMELPGFSEKDVDIQIDKNVLTISSKKEEEKNDKKIFGKNKDEKWLVKERKSASFSRSFTLPEDVKNDAIKASVKDGILCVVLPHSEKSTPRRIAIEAA